MMPDAGQVYSNVRNFKSDLKKFKPHFLIVVPRLLETIWKVKKDKQCVMCVWDFALLSWSESGAVQPSFRCGVVVLVAWALFVSPACNLYWNLLRRKHAAFTKWNYA